MEPTERIRVLWLIKGLGPGGAERLLTAMADTRDRSAFDVRAAYLLPHKDHLVAELEALGVPVRCLDGRDERDLRWAMRLRSMLVDSPVDVVHTHSPYVAGIARLVVRTLPRRARPRTVSTEHNAWTRFHRPTRWLHAWTSGMDAATIAVSDEVARSIRGRAAGRVETLTHGIALGPVRRRRSERAATRAELGVRDDEVLVGTVANYVAQKDYPNLLRAARLLVDRGVAVRVCAIGQGPLEAEVQALHRELGLDRVVTLTGYRPDAVRLLGACDLFTLASRFEGLPVALMEAMALGLPVVATEVGGIPTVVEHGTHGLLVPPGDPDRLADALGALVADRARREAMGAAAALRSERFDAARATRRVEEIYRAVAAGEFARPHEGAPR